MTSTPLASRTRRVVGLAMGGLVVLVGAYVVLVLTRIGQAIGDSAYLSRLGEGRFLREFEKAFPTLVDVRVVVLVGVALLVIGALRRRFLLGLAMSLGYAGAMLSAEVLKRILPRPDLAPAFESLLGAKDAMNSFPSGHTTMATATSLGVMMLVSVRARPWVAIGGMAFTTAMATSVVSAGWHRPSDAIGGVGLALCWMGCATAWIMHRRASIVIVPRSVRVVPWVGLAFVAATLVVFTASLLRGNAGNVPKDINEWTLPVTLTAVVAWLVVALTTMQRATRDVEFRRPRRPRHLSANLGAAAVADREDPGADDGAEAVGMTSPRHCLSTDVDDHEDPGGEGQRG